MPTPNRYGDLSSDARVAAINAQLASDQTYQQLFQQYQLALSAGPPSKNHQATTAYAAVVKYLADQGLQPPDGYTPFSQNGQLVRQPQTTWRDLLVPALPVLGGLGAAALGVGGGFGAGAGGGSLGAAGSIGAEGEAGATTATAGGIEGGAFGLPASSAAAIPGAAAAPAVGDLTASYGVIPGGLGDLSAPGTVAGNVTDASQIAGGGSALGGVSGFLKNNLSWLSPLIGVGGQIGGALISANATKDAAEIQKQYLEDALAYEKERDAYARTTEANRYGSMEQQLAPYQAAGREATGAMTRFLGLPDAAPGPVSGTNYTINPNIASGGAIPPGSPTTMPVPIPGGYQGGPPINANPAQSATATTVPVRAPNGQTYQVPTERVAEAVANGGQVVNG